MTNNEVWVHYSISPDKIIPHSVEQVPFAKDQDVLWSKPRGLWITPLDVEDNWHQWCTGEGFRTDHLKYEHVVTLAPDAKLLRLETEQDIKDIAEKHGFGLMAELYTPDEMIRNEARYGKQYVDHLLSKRDGIYWENIAKNYQGILIPQYIWECRLKNETAWYYPWDCASGCIWDASAISSIDLATKYKAA